MDSSSGSFEEFVQAHVEGLVRLAHLITWDEPTAEDLVQECLIRVAKHWPKVKEMEHPVAYARRVLVNLALDSKNRRSQERAELTHPLPALSDEHTSSAIEGLGVREELLHSLGQLPRQQRTVLGLRYFLDFSEAQTADLLGCSTGTVKSSASRGLARLRELIVSTPPANEVCDS